MKQRVLFGTLITGILGMTGWFVTHRSSDDHSPAPMKMFDFESNDQLGEPISTKQLRGEVWVAHIVPRSCASDCLQALEELARGIHALRIRNAWQDIKFLLISGSSELKKDDALEMSRELGMTATDWSFATGASPALYAFEQDTLHLGAGEQIPVLLVDGEGAVHGRYEFQTEKGRSALNRALKHLKAKTSGEKSAKASFRAPTTKEGLNPLAWMEERARKQNTRLDETDLRIDFTLLDRLEDSGISFHHESSLDSGKAHRPVHYDHGSGVAAADIDGDGLVDLYFVNQIGPDELWKNLGGGRFKDITQSAGLLASRDRFGVAASFADIDNDGDPDLYVTSVRGGNVLYENRGDETFADISDTSGLGYVGHSSAATFFDYDNDGLLDLFLANVGVYTSDEKTLQETSGGTVSYYSGLDDGFAGHLKPKRTEKSRLYRNQGDNRFVDVSLALSLSDSGWNGDASAADLNGDGWQDLYVLNMQGHDSYYENREGRGFELRTDAYFPKTPWGSMGLKVFDANRDGTWDLYVTDMHSDMTERVGPDREHLKPTPRWPESFLRSEGKSIFGNALFLGKDSSYTERSDAWGAENYWPWGISVGDMNADGFQDIFVTASMNYPFRYSTNLLLMNDGGRRFLDAAFATKIEPRKDNRYAKVWFSLECRGEDQGHRDCIPGQQKVDIYSALGSRSSVMFDVDNDGDLDLVTNEFNDTPMVLMSDLSETRTNLNFVSLKLVGTNSNRDALGAVVRIRSDGKEQMLLNDGASGYLSHSLLPIYVGLGESTSLDSIEVTWPGGDKELFSHSLKTNQLLTLTQRSGEKVP